MAILGLKNRVLNSDALWLCTVCFTCTDRCPQNIEVASVIRVFRNLAIETGYIPQVFKNQLSAVLDSGYAYKIPELRIKKRETQGLPPLPSCNIENLIKILKNTKIIQKTIQASNGETPNGT
jgi:heterodisulfide reductase subunit C